VGHRLPSPISRRTTKLSRGGRAERQSTPPNQHRGRRRLQRLDTDHGLAWDGPGPVPRVYGLEAAKLRPKRGIFRKAVAFQPRCGLRLPDLSKGDHDACLQPTAPILLRRPTARQEHVPVHPRLGLRRRKVRDGFLGSEGRPSQSPFWKARRQTLQSCLVQPARPVDTRFRNESLAAVSRASCAKGYTKNWNHSVPSAVRPLEF
jgi:hypothetical protein